jgi:hypothetical protein
MNSTLRAAALTAGALALVVGSSAGSAPAHRGDFSQSLDLTSSAHPSEATPDVIDHAVDVSSTSARNVRAHASALASATCDGCHGDAATLQVLYVDGAADTSVDNAAVAWAQCAECRGTALSVQVVVLDGRKVAADNRAFAANAVCAVCQVEAMAYQLVVVSPDQARLSTRASRDLRAWVRTQAAALRRDPTGLVGRSSARAERRATATLERLVNGDRGSRTREVDVEHS